MKKEDKMKVKNLLKLISVVCICICCGFICNYMQHLGPALYNGIFEAFDSTNFILVTVLAVCGTIILKKWVRSKKGYYFYLGIIFITSFFVLSRGELILQDKFMPGIDTIMLDKASEVPNFILNKWVFMDNYFENKKLIVPNEESKDIYQFIYKMTVPPSKILATEEMTISEEDFNKILSYPYFNDDPYYFVIDEYWESSDRIRMIKIKNKYIFCSESYLNNIEWDKGRVETTYDGDNEEATLILSELIKSRPYRNVKQSLVMILLLTIGLTITLPLWGKDYPVLALSMGLPVGAATWCMCGIILMMLNIPYNLFSMFGSLIIIIGFWTRKNQNMYKGINWQKIYNLILLALIIIVVFVYAKIYITSFDSIVKCAMGYRLAKFGTLRDILVNVAPYGMLEPIIMSIGFMAKCDMLYSFYPLMAISGIGILGAGVYYFNYEKKNYVPMIVLAGSVLLMLTNYDYIEGYFYVMAHGPIAVYTLIMVMFIMMKKQVNMYSFELPIVLSAAMILVTRVEGAVYILFILTVSLGIENEYLKMKKVNVIVALMTIIWNGFQILFTGPDANPLFWTPDRGVLLIIASIAVLVFSLIINRDWRLLVYIKERLFLYIMAGMVLGLIFITVFFKRSMAAANFPVYLAHFSNNVKNGTNSGALWTFALLLSLMIICLKNRTAQYAVTIIWGYVLLIFIICLFRGEVPLRFGYGDSARRTLVQIMPTMVWVLAMCTGEIEKIESH